MASVVWTYDSLWSYESPRNPWTEEEALTYTLAYTRGYESYKILQGVLCVLVSLFCKRRKRYAKLAVPTYSDREVVNNAERRFGDPDPNVNMYLAERLALFLHKIDLSSVLTCYNIIDEMNRNIDMGMYTFQDTVIFPLQSDLYNKPFLTDSGVIVWLTNNEYVGPLISWRIAFEVHDTTLASGVELLSAVERAIFHNRQDIADLVIAIDNEYNPETVDRMLAQYSATPQEEVIPEEDLTLNDTTLRHGSLRSFRNIGDVDPFPDIRTPPQLDPLEEEQQPSRSPTPFDDILAPATPPPTDATPLRTPDVSYIHPLIQNITQTPPSEDMQYNRARTGN